MRNRLDEELALLHKDLIEMGAINERALGYIPALFGKKGQSEVEETKKMIRECEVQVDELERIIQSRAMHLLMSQQPVASDLRCVSTALHVVTDMERIADQAYDIADIAMFFAGKDQLGRLERIEDMVGCCQQMVHRSVDAFVAQNLRIATEVIKMDDEVDRLFNEIRDELIRRIDQNRETGEQAIDCIMIAKYLERIGDHAVNIAEWVVFQITGEHKNQPIMLGRKIG